MLCRKATIFDFIPSKSSRCCLFSANFNFGKIKKSQGAKFGEYGGRIINHIFFFSRNCVCGGGEGVLTQCANSGHCACSTHAKCVLSTNSKHTRGPLLVLASDSDSSSLKTQEFLSLLLALKLFLESFSRGSSR